MNHLKYDLEALSNRFLQFAESECEGVSPMYFHLSNLVLKDEELLLLAAHCRLGQPMPNLFFGAIHFLLLNDPSLELAKYYPSVHRQASEILPIDLLKSFCESHCTEIKDILANKIVQTNALNRTAYLMPTVSSLFDGESINLVDIGTSAGLTLNFDLYEYHYNGKHQFGNSSVKINSEIKEGNLPEFKNTALVNKKIGIDQNPLDLKVEANANWLKALIWSDQTERFTRMKEAIKVAQTTDFEMLKADEVEAFKAIILEQDQDCPLVVYHTHALYQFPQENRQAFWNMLNEIGKERDFYHIGVEGSTVLNNDYGTKGVLVELNTYKNGAKQSQLIAETNGHANWIKWKNK